MRIPNYISPTALKQHEKNPSEYYLRYLADTRPPRFPQTKPMSVGSAFDAEVKSYLHNRLFGNGTDIRFERDTIFEAQVESHNRDWARVAGKHVFECYKNFGALADLMLELNQSASAPRFEFSIQDVISTSVGQVPILGKPDVFFINSEGCRVIIDWKVNGYCGKSPKSPEPGYIKVRDCWAPSVKKPSLQNHCPHPKCWPTLYKGIKINPTKPLEQVNDEWADQLIMYSWLLGEEPGSQDLILGIDQIVCAHPATETAPPYLRVATHRTTSSAQYQYALVTRLASLWQSIQNGYRDTLTEDQISILESQAASFSDPDSFEAFCAGAARTNV